MGLIGDTTNDLGAKILQAVAEIPGITAPMLASIKTILDGEIGAIAGIATQAEASLTGDVDALVAELQQWREEAVRWRQTFSALAGGFQVVPASLLIPPKV